LYRNIVQLYSNMSRLRLGCTNVLDEMIREAV